MLSEQDKTFLGKIFLNYNFTMTTAQLNKEKLYYRDIQRMLDEGLIEKVKRGYQLSEGEFIKYKGRKYAWLGIDSNGIIKLPQSTLEVLELQSGMELLSIRSSDIAFTMGAKGPLLEKAYNFRGEIERY